MLQYTASKFERPAVFWLSDGSTRNVFTLGAAGRSAAALREKNDLLRNSLWVRGCMHVCVYVHVCVSTFVLRQCDYSESYPAESLIAQQEIETLPYAYAVPPVLPQFRLFNTHLPLFAPLSS